MEPKYQGIAQTLATKGRYGDTELVHMNPIEVAAMERMIPGGLTINPETGQKEAFAFLIPMLGGMAGSAALGGVLGTTAATALGAGAAQWAATGDLEQGITAGILGGIGAGVGSSLGGGNFAGTVGDMNTSMLNSINTGPSAGTGSVAGGTTGATTGPGSIPGGPSAAQMPAAQMPADYQSMLDYGVGDAIGGPSAAQMPAAQMPADYQSMLDYGVGDAAGTNAQLNSFGDGTPGGYEATTGYYSASPGKGMLNARTHRGEMPRTLGEFGTNFAHEVTSPMGATFLGLGLAGEAMKPQPYNYDGEDEPSFYKEEQFPDNPRKWNAAPAGYRPGKDPEYKYFAEGGLAQGANPQQKAMLESGGYAQNEDPLIAEVKAAIMGSHPDPQRAIQAFIGKYGEQAFNQLRTQIVKAMSGNEGLTQGPGGGMDDAIPATIDGSEPAALSDGEFVIPADVVSGLGDGSTDAGAGKLYNMVDNVRVERTGMKNQPRQIDDKAAMPA
jgi:hypothetical protein